MEGYTYPFLVLFLYSISVVCNGIPRSYLHFFNLYSSPMSSQGIQCSVLQWLALNTYNRLMIAPPHIFPVPLFSSFNKTVHDVSFLSASPPLIRRWNLDVLLRKNEEVYIFYFTIIKLNLSVWISNKSFPIRTICPFSLALGGNILHRIHWHRINTSCNNICFHWWQCNPSWDCFWF